MRIGYARVSTSEQNLDLQKDALSRAGCEKIIEEMVSGKAEHRSGLDRVREQLREGDVLVVWRLDRLGRSLKHLIELMTELEQQKVGFQSLQESIDTTTPGGKLVFHIFGALAEFERNLIRDRTKAGLEALGPEDAKAVDPRSSAHNSAPSRLISTTRRSTGSLRICLTLGISKPTLYAIMRESTVSGPDEGRYQTRPTTAVVGSTSA